MIKTFCRLAFVLAVLTPISAHAQLLFDTISDAPGSPIETQAPVMPAPVRQQMIAPPTPQQIVATPVPSPTVSSAPISAANNLQEAQIRGITNTLMEYPEQAPQILRNYIGIDPSKVNFDRFMQIVQSGDYQQVYNQVSTLYADPAAFNSGQMASAGYYQAVPPAPVPAEPLHTAATLAPHATYMTPTAFYTAAGVAVAAVAGTAAAIGTGSGSGGHHNSSNGEDVFNRDSLPDLYDPNDFVDTEFSAYNMDALNKSNAQYAYAKGLSGAGVTIGFYDRFNTLLSADPELSARVVYSNYDIANDRIDTGNQYPSCIGHETDDYCDHGRTVMEYAAAELNGSGTHGFAYGADLMALSWNAAPTAQTLADQSPDIINFSCSGCVTLTDVRYIATKGILITASTGNDSSDPTPLPSSGAYYAGDATVDGRIIAVTGAYLPGGVLNNPYTPCGAVKDHCLTAYSNQGTSFAAPQVAGAAALIKEGWNFLTAKQIGQILLASAKDIGAPGVDAIYGHGLLDVKAAVSPIGALSMMTGQGLSANFSPSMIAQNQRTAFGDAFSNSKNAKGNAVLIDSFGRDFAVKAQDHLVVAKTDTLTPQTMKAFGNKANFKTVNYNDRLSMRFNNDTGIGSDHGLAGFAEYKATPSTKIVLGFTNDIGDVPANDMQKFNTADFIDTGAFKNGFLNFSDNNQVYYQAIEVKSGKNVKTKLSSYYSKNGDVDYFQPLNNQITSDYTSTVAETMFSPVDTVGINFKNGMTHENDSLLGTKFSGSFDMANGADTYFTGLDVSYDVTPTFNLFGSYTFGMTRTSPAATSAFSDISAIQSDSFSMTATQRELTGHDRLSVSIGQPTRVRSGTASGLTQHVDHATGMVSTTSFEQNLTPSGRTLMFQAAYAKELSDDIDMNFAVEYVQQPYQQKDADPETSALIKLRYKFQ